MSYQCPKGCSDPTAKDGRMWHESKNECAFETYNPKWVAGRPGKQRAKGHPQIEGARDPQDTTPPATLAIKTAPGAQSSVTFTDKKADVTKGTSKPVEPVVVDYIVDGPHTKALWNFGMRGLYFVHVKIDEWAFDWHKHLPKVQFQLSKNAEMSIEMDPRNLYSRSVTWFTKNICRCKNLQQAHAAIDSILFFEAFGGIGVALIFHYEEVYKQSPKMKARREAKRLKMEALKRGRAVDTTGVVISTVQSGAPSYTTQSSAAGVVAMTQ